MSTEVLRRLEGDGLLRSEAEVRRTTRRWQAAMARAAFRLYGESDPHSDLRVPIALAFVEIYGDAIDEAEMASLVEAMLPIEHAELDPRGHIERVLRPGV